MAFFFQTPIKTNGIGHRNRTGQKGSADRFCQRLGGQIPQSKHAARTKQAPETQLAAGDPPEACLPPRGGPCPLMLVFLLSLRSLTFRMTYGSRLPRLVGRETQGTRSPLASGGLSAFKAPAWLTFGPATSGLHASRQLPTGLQMQKVTRHQFQPC